MMSFVTNHGAFVRILNIFDWNLSKISTLDFEADPHNCNPYVQIGLIIVLYRRTLLCSESLDLLSSNPCVFLSLIPICFLLDHICVFHVILRSRCIPRYFAVSACGISMLFSFTVGHVSLFSVNVTCTDFYSLALMCHILSYSSILYKFS